MENFHIELYFDSVKDCLSEAESYKVRREAVNKFSWAIPTNSLMRNLKPYCLNGIIEVCAGNGYWAKCFSSMGIDVEALDIRPWKNQWFPIQEGRSEDAGLYPDRVLFLCWPPYDDPAAAKALQAYTKAGGNRLIFVGEGYYGCTANEAFFRYLSKFYTEEDHFFIPQWDGIHDYVRVFDRKQIERVK